MEHLDFIAPMIYPSHYPSGYKGFKNPADHPYEVIYNSMKNALLKTDYMGSDNVKKMRPWIQDFDLGAKYDKQKVTAQIRALKDLGIESYMVWDPRNTYTKSAFAEIIGKTKKTVKKKTTEQKETISQ